VDVARLEMVAHRAQASDLLAQTREARVCIGSRIDAAAAEYQRESHARLAEANSEWSREREVLDLQISTCQAAIAAHWAEDDEVRLRVCRLRRRTAVARIGRAGAAWKHETFVQAQRQKVRCARAVGLRKLNREKEKQTKEVNAQREALNKEVRRAEQEDENLRQDRAGEIKDLRDQVELLEDRIECVEERMKQKEILADAVDIVPISEGERMRRWAEAASCAGKFKNASQRLQMRSHVPGLGVEEDNSWLNLRKTQQGSGSSSSPSLPQIQGGLRQLEAQMNDCRQLL